MTFQSNNYADRFITETQTIPQSKAEVAANALNDFTNGTHDALTWLFGYFTAFLDIVVHTAIAVAVIMIIIYVLVSWSNYRNRNRD